MRFSGTGLLDPFTHKIFSIDLYHDSCIYYLYEKRTSDFGNPALCPSPTPCAGSPATACQYSNLGHHDG